MRIRLLAPAAAAAVLVAAVAGPAVATGTAAAPRPAAGTASNALTLLSLALAGHDVRVGTVALTSDTLSGSPTSKVVVTPVRADGTSYGEQTVTAANSPASVPSFNSAATLPAALSSVASIQSPVFDVASSNSPASSSAGAASLGSIKVLGLPVALNGTVDVSSLVNGTNAVGEKTLTVKNLALPSIADILGALGLNLKALPIKTLTDLLNGLKLGSTAVTAAQKALTDAQAAIKTQIDAAQKAVDDQQVKVDAAKTALATQLKALDGAKVNLTAAQAAVTTAQTAFDAAKAQQTSAKSALDATTAQIATADGGLVVGSPAYDLFLAANPALASALQAATAAYNSATALVTSTGTALANAKTVADAAQVAVNTLQAAVNAAQKLLDDAVALLNSLINTLKGLLGQFGPQIDALLAAITAVLDGTPLVSIDSFTVQTKAAVTSAAAGGQIAKVVGGEIQGVHVLGTDVLANVLGNTKINVLDLAGSTLAQVTSKIDALNGILSSVLSAVPGLSIAAPQVDLLTKSTSTSVSNGFGLASTSVRALSISIPAITLPAALALPGAASLPAISGVPSLSGATGALGIAAVGDLVSKPITLGLGTLTEQAKFQPAVTAAPDTTPPGTVTPPELPRTGLPAGVALVALLLVGGGLALRRRFTAEF